MRKLYKLDNFSAGINQSLDAAADDIVNFNVQTDGTLSTRAGMDFGGSGVEALTYYANPNSVGGAGVNSMTNVVQTFFLGGHLFIQTTIGLFYRTETQSYFVENKTGIDDGQGGTSNVLWTTAYWTNKYHVVEANRDRAFIANGKYQFWLDLTGNYPFMYKWGIDAPSFDTSKVALNTSSLQGGGYIEAGFYAYALEYENIYGGLSPLSTRVIVEQTGENNTNRATITLPVPLDTQIKYVNIYRTEKQEPIPADSFTEIEGTLAQNAPLKLAHQYDLTAAITNRINSSGPSELDWTEAARAIGVSKIATTEFCSKPPQSLDNITLHAGRIWGSMKQEEPASINDLPVDGDMVCFSAIDDTGAPLYDVFPIVKQTTSSSNTVTASPLLPHQIKVKDVVSAIGKSRNYLAVFGASSIQLVKGQGIIEGMYSLKMPNTDLDASDFLDSVGAKQFCVSEMNGNLYFYNDTDKRVYRLDNNAQLSWISMPIQASLNAHGSADVKNLIADDGQVYLLVTDSSKLSQIYIFEEFRQIWTHYNCGTKNLVGLSVNSLENSLYTRGNSFFSAPSSVTYVNGSPGIYSLGDKGTNTAVYRLFDSAAITDDQGQVSVSVSTPEFFFARPTRIDNIKVLMNAASATATFSIDVDGTTEAVKVPNSLLTEETSYTLNKSNNYSVRLFATGYRFKIKVQLSGSHTIHGLEVQFRGK